MISLSIYVIHIVIRSETNFQVSPSRVPRIFRRSCSTTRVVNAGVAGQRARGAGKRYHSARRLCCCSLRRGVAAGSRRRGGDPAPAAGPGNADADSERASGRAPDPVAADIGADDRRFSAERLRAARLAPVGRRSPRSHLHAVRGLRQLRCPGRLAAAHRVRHC